MGRVSIKNFAINYFIGTLFVFTGFLIGQGQYINFINFYIPWNHDDFSALSGYKHFYTIRPVSSNLIYILGEFGELFYYSFFCFLWFSCLFFTQIFILKILDISSDRKFLFICLTTGSIIWFLQPQSVMNLQYLGLMTNTLSYFFGICAGLILLHLTSNSDSYNKNIFFVFILMSLSSFSKEDMVLFLLLVCIYSMIAFKATAIKKRRHIINVSLLILLVFSISIGYSIFNKSPFVFSNNPEYRINIFSLLFNALENLNFYLFGSKGVLALLLIALASSMICFFKKNLIFINIFFIVLLSLSIMIPYLALPRKFYYYSMSFIPLLSFLVMPCIAILKDTLFPKLFTSNVSSLLFFLISSVFIISIFWWIDYSSRDFHHNRIAALRERSAIQFREVAKFSPDLKDCKKISVSGISNELGPFLHNSEEYLSKILGKRIAWQIIVEPDTRLHKFSQRIKKKKRNSHYWDYIIPQDSIESIDCSLEFNPETLIATFYRN